MQERQLTFFAMYLFSLKPKFSAGHNSQTVWDNLIIIGRNINRVKFEYHMQEGQLLLWSHSGYLS